MKLQVIPFALAGGTVWSLGLFILTWMNILGYGESFTVIKSYYIGYSVTPLGSVIGAAWAFVDAGICCAVFALVYNLFAKK
jgi:hypothetical protein